MKIAYVDSSVVVSYYLPGESAHQRAVELLTDDDMAVVTATLTRIEVSAALVRAARTGRVGAVDDVLDRLDHDFENGLITMVAPDANDVDALALQLVRTHGLRAIDAIHVAVASLALPALTGPHDEATFVSRDAAQAEAARALGLPVG